MRLESNLPKAMQAEAQATIEAANGDQAADVGRMGFTASEERLAVELYVPRGEDEEILQHLQGAKVELGDEVCTRLLVQKVRSAPWQCSFESDGSAEIHADVLKQRVGGLRVGLERALGSRRACGSCWRSSRTARTPWFRAEHRPKGVEIDRNRSKS